MDHSNYTDVIKSDKFRELGSLKKESVNFKCEICGNTDRQLHTHHLTYENLGNESMSDLLIACDLCHLDIHSTEPKNRNRKIAA